MSFLIYINMKQLYHKHMHNSNKQTPNIEEAQFLCKIIKNTIYNENLLKIKKNISSLL